ncbi:MAG: hypothetical protein K2K38_05470 [Clostridia bacterium]|nr:hypothetical protein [Clostridia bacterium]
MKNPDTVIWKTQIPKKLYNKIKYYFKQFGGSRADFLDFGIDALVIKYQFHHYEVIPEPEILYRFSEEDEANLVGWQVAIGENVVRGYNDFMMRYGLTGRDVLAAALYQNRGK